MDVSAVAGPAVLEPRAGRRDGRGRLMGGDVLYFQVCECGNLKGWQAETCRQCYVDGLRDRDYWRRRTCACGAAKSRNGRSCRRCYIVRVTGVPRAGSSPPANHPWRKSARRRGSLELPPGGPTQRS